MKAGIGLIPEDRKWQGCFLDKPIFWNVSIVLIVLPLSLLSAFVWHLSPVAVTFILNSDQIFKCVPAFIRANRYTWVKKLTRT